MTQSRVVLLVLLNFFAVGGGATRDLLDPQDRLHCRSASLMADSVQDHRPYL